MNQIYFTEHFVSTFHFQVDELVEKAPLLFELLAQSTRFYHYHLSSAEFVDDYLESNGEFYGRQEIEEFTDFYQYVLAQNRNLSPGFSVCPSPSIRLENPEYFMAQVFYRYPLKRWVSQLVWVIDHYKKYQEIKLNLDSYPERFLDQVFFEWKLEEEFDRVEPLLNAFRLFYVYV